LAEIKFDVDKMTEEIFGKEVDYSDNNLGGI
jgi:hypothetical protein